MCMLWGSQWPRKNNGLTCCWTRRCEPEFDAWRRRHPDLPSIGGAFHILAEVGLRVDASATATKPAKRTDLPPLPAGRKIERNQLNAKISQGALDLLEWYEAAQKIIRWKAVDELIRDGVLRYAEQVGAIASPIAADPIMPADPPLAQ